MKAIKSNECPVPWKYCAEHDFTYLYGNRCPNCITKEKNMSEQVKMKDECDVIIGMDKVGAMKFLASKDIITRIAVEDNETFFLTMDFNPTRVNLEIKAGKVVAYHRS